MARRPLATSAKNFFSLETPSLDVNTTFPTIGINKCGIVDDKTQILGYSLDKRQAVYQRKCAGICLSRVDVGGGNTQQYECKPNL